MRFTEDVNCLLDKVCAVASRQDPERYSVVLDVLAKAIVELEESNFDAAEAPEHSVCVRRVMQ